MSKEKVNQNVHIEGDRNAFLTKGAIDRFKTDIKNQIVKDANSYFKDGWNYEKTEEENRIHIKLINNQNNDNDKKEQKVSKNKLLLQVRLSDLSNKRKNENQLKHQLQKNNKNVPEDLIDSYLEAKKLSRNPVIDPCLVYDNPDAYWQHINGTVQNCGNSSNPFASYYRMLQTYLITEKAKQQALSS